MIVLEIKRWERKMLALDIEKHSVPAEDLNLQPSDCPSNAPGHHWATDLFLARWAYVWQTSRSAMSKASCVGKEKQRRESVTDRPRLINFFSSLSEPRALHFFELVLPNLTVKKKYGLHYSYDYRTNWSQQGSLLYSVLYQFISHQNLGNCCWAFTKTQLIFPDVHWTCRFGHVHAIRARETRTRSVSDLAQK